MRTPLCCLVVALLAPGSILAQGPVLKWKSLETKKPFFLEMITTTDQSLTVAGMTNKQHQKQVFWFRWSPQDKDRGGYKVVQEIIGMAIQINIGGNIIGHDSRDKNPPGRINRFFESLVGSRYTLHINPTTMAVEKVEGVDQLVAKLAKANPAMEPLLKSILSDHACRGLSSEMFRYFPTGGVVPKSKQWNGTDISDMGSVGQFASKYRYKYLGKKGKLHRIGVHFDMNYIRPEQPDGILPFVIQMGTLKGKDCRGEILFDDKKGRLAKSTATARLEGKLEVKIGDQVTTVILTQTQTVEIRVYDQNPIKKRPVEKSRNRGFRY